MSDEADNTGISGGMAAILAAHPGFGCRDDYVHCAGLGCWWMVKRPCSATEATWHEREFAAHQAAVLTAAGYGNTTALLNDLRAEAAVMRDGLRLNAVIARHTQEDTP